MIGDLPDPVGHLSLNDSYLIAQIADAAAFRVWCGAANQAEALLKIHQDGLPDPIGETYTREELQGYRPFCICSHLPRQAMTWDHDATSAPGWNYKQSGRAWAYFEEDLVRISAGPLARNVKNLTGRIVADVLALSGTAGYLGIERLTLFGPETPTDEAGPSQGPILMFGFEIHYGTP